MLDYYLQSPTVVNAICKAVSMTVSYTKKGINYTKRLLRIKMLDEVREELKDLAGLYYTMKKEPVEERLVGYQAYCEHVDTHIEPPRSLRELRRFEGRLERRLGTMN